MTLSAQLEEALGKYDPKRIVPALKRKLAEVSKENKTRSEWKVELGPLKYGHKTVVVTGLTYPRATYRYAIKKQRNGYEVVLIDAPMRVRRSYDYYGDSSEYATSEGHWEIETAFAKLGLKKALWGPAKARASGWQPHDPSFDEPEEEDPWY